MDHIIQQTQVYTNRFTQTELQEKKGAILRSFKPIKIDLETSSPYCVELDSQFYSIFEASLIFKPDRIRKELKKKEEELELGKKNKYKNTFVWLNYVIDMVEKKQ